MTENEKLLILELSKQDSLVFAKAMLEPVPINDRLRETVRRYLGAAEPQRTE